VADVARGVIRGELRGPIETLEPGHLPAVGRSRGDGGEHPTLDEGESGVNRTGSTDPGHD
jgi:hypothetical protein